MIEAADRGRLSQGMKARQCRRNWREQNGAPDGQNYGQQKSKTSFAFRVDVWDLA
jgi:hypothetical protein